MPSADRLRAAALLLALAGFVVSTVALVVVVIGDLLARP